MKIDNNFVGMELRRVEEEPRDFFVISVEDFEVGSDDLVGVDVPLSWSQQMLFGFYLRGLDNVLPGSFV